MSESLDGKVALVTGGGRSLGRAHALTLAAAGAAVLVNDLGADSAGCGADEAPAAGVVNEIIAMGGRAASDHNDISDWNAAGRVVHSAIEAFGRLDIVVNNAGVSVFNPIDRETEANWRFMLDVNLTGTAAISHWASAYWREAGPEAGRAIVNTSSPAGTRPEAGVAAYSVAKAGVAALTVTSAGELASLGVRVNAIAPMAYTRMTEAFLDALPPEMITKAEPEHVSNLVRYLVSPYCDFTGRVFGVEGNRIFLYNGYSAELQFASTAPAWTDETIAEALAAVDRQDRSFIIAPGVYLRGATPTDEVVATLREFGNRT